MTKEELKQQIIEAFNGVTLGNGVGLLQAQARDNYQTKEEELENRRKDEKENWAKISIENLRDYESSLSFFDTEGMRFHLPAFMLADLEDGAMSTIFHLTHMESKNSFMEDRFSRFKEIFSGLNDVQRKAVKDFLLYYLENNPGYDHTGERKVILRALEKYWN